MPTRRNRAGPAILAIVTLFAGVLLTDLASEVQAQKRSFKKKNCLDCHEEFREQYGSLKNQHPGVKNGSCDTCHRTEDTPEELSRVKGVYGFGTGEFMLDNPHGDPVDALKFLDEDGQPITDWVHSGTGPLAPEVRDRAIGVILTTETDR